MRVLLANYDSRGGLEPLLGPAVRLRELGVEVRVCAPPDEEFARRLAGVGVPLVPFGRSVRALMTAATPPKADGVPRRAAELLAQFDAVAAAAEGCDVLVATGLLPAAACVRAVADRLGIRYVYASFQSVSLPSPHHPPMPRPGRPLPSDVTDRRALRPGPDLRVPVGGAGGGPAARDARTGGRRRRHGPYGRGGGGGEAAPRHGRARLSHPPAERHPPGDTHHAPRTTDRAGLSHTPQEDQ